MTSQVITARRRDLGGFEVGRVLPAPQRRMVGPFVFFDHLGPLALPAGIPRRMDVRPHPHIGLATITYLFEGELTHRDSLGFEQPIRPREVNWMTAGRGITHSERFDGMRERGGAIHGLQAWVALPTATEECEPAFEHYEANVLPEIVQPGVSMRLIAGTAYGRTSPVRTASPLLYVHARVARGARLSVPTGCAELAAYVVEGRIEVHASEASHEPGSLVVLDAPAVGGQAGATLRAVDDSTVMLLGGEPVGHRYVWWNFVSSSVERIERAKADWKAGRFELPARDHDEFIPLPDDPGPRPQTL